MEQISKHISYDEAVLSPTALRAKIDNTPNDDVLEAMKHVSNNLFEPLREWYGKPIKINSFYRCEKLNKLVKGASTSQHVKGEAIDISAGSKDENKKLFDWVNAHMEFDQLINEYDYTWVHISLRKNNNRNQVLVVK